MSNDGGRGAQPMLKPEPSDEVVEAIITQYPEGAPLIVIGQVMGLSRERAYQILNQAIAKCRKKAVAKGITLADLPRERETLWERMET